MKEPAPHHHTTNHLCMEQYLKLFLNTYQCSEPSTFHLCLILLPMRPSGSLDMLVAGSKSSQKLLHTSSTESFLLFFEVKSGFVDMTLFISAICRLELMVSFSLGEKRLLKEHFDLFMMFVTRKFRSLLVQWQCRLMLSSDSDGTSQSCVNQSYKLSHE